MSEQANGPKNSSAAPVGPHFEDVLMGLIQNHEVHMPPMPTGEAGQSTDFQYRGQTRRGIGTVAAGATVALVFTVGSCVYVKESGFNVTDDHGVSHNEPVSAVPLITMPPSEMTPSAIASIPEVTESAMTLDETVAATETAEPSHEIGLHGFPLVNASPPERIVMETDTISIDVQILPLDGAVDVIDETGKELYDFSAPRGEFENAYWFTQAGMPSTDPAYREAQIEKNLGLTVTTGAHQSGVKDAAYNGLIEANVNIGDIYKIFTAKGIFTYKVIDKVDPLKSELSEYEQAYNLGDDKRSIMVACVPDEENPGARSKQNYLVVGELIDVEPIG